MGEKNKGTGEIGCGVRGGGGVVCEGPEWGVGG